VVVAVVALGLGGGSVWSNTRPVIYSYCKMAKSGDRLFAGRELGLFASFANKIPSPVL